MSTKALPAEESKQITDPKIIEQLDQIAIENGVTKDSKEYKMLERFLSDEEALATVVEFAESTAIELGFDWEKMTIEEQTMFTAQIMESYNVYTTDYMEKIPDPEVQKRLKLIIATGFNTELMEKSTDVINWLDIMNSHFIMYLKEVIVGIESEKM